MSAQKIVKLIKAILVINVVLIGATDLLPWIHLHLLVAPANFPIHDSYTQGWQSYYLAWIVLALLTSILVSRHRWQWTAVAIATNIGLLIWAAIDYYQLKQDQLKVSLVSTINYDIGFYLWLIATLSNLTLFSFMLRIRLAANQQQP